MSAALQPSRMTREEFLAWDETQEGRWEYDGHGPLAMTGGTFAHVVISHNLNGLLWEALRGKACQALAGDCGSPRAGRSASPTPS